MPHHQCIKVNWSIKNEGVTWSSFFFGPEEGKTEWTENSDAWNSILVALARNQIPTRSKVYGLMRSFLGNEFRSILKDAQDSGVLSNDPNTLLSRAASVLRGPVILVEGTREQLPRWYETYRGWSMSRWWFMASRHPLDNWQGELRRLDSRSRISKQLLDRVELILFNHFEHGIEVISKALKANALQSIAENVSTEFSMPLTIQDLANPFGDSD